LLAHFPVPLELTRYPVVSGSFTYLGALLPLRIRSLRPRRTGVRRPMLSWSFALLETSSSLGTSTRRTLAEARARHAPASEDAGLATTRTSRPSQSGGASSTLESAALVSSAASDLLRDRPAPSLDGDPNSLDLHPQQIATAGLRSLEVPEVRRLSEEIRLPLPGFPASSTTSQLRSLTNFGLCVYR
jgi:hypothetical protein